MLRLPEAALEARLLRPAERCEFYPPPRPAKRPAHSKTDLQGERGQKKKRLGERAR